MFKRIVRVILISNFENTTNICILTFSDESIEFVTFILVQSVVLETIVETHMQILILKYYNYIPNIKFYRLLVQSYRLF